MEKINERIEWIDIAKGIGIILIIFCHTSIPNKILKLILSFNVPLFFFLSGYTFKLKDNFRSFVSKRIRMLIYPYFIFSFITYLFWFIVERKLLKNMAKINPVKPLIGIFYGNNIGNYMIFDGVLWFISCLFITELLFYIIARIAIKKSKIFLILLFFLVIGFVDSQYMSMMLPWGIDIAFVAVVFYGTGYIIKNSKYNIENLMLPLKIIFSIISIILVVLISHINTIVYMFNNIYGNYFYFYIAAFSGILICLILSITINKSKELSYIGRNTFIILVVHPKVLELLNLIFHKLFKLNVNNSLIYGCVFTILSIVIILPVIYIVNNYFLFVLGKQSSISNVKRK